MGGYVYVCSKCHKFLPAVRYSSGEMVPRGNCEDCGDVIAVIGLGETRKMREGEVEKREGGKGGGKA